jgi:hypothetical protein
MKIGVTDTVALLAAGAIVYGTALLSHAAAWIIGGLFGLGAVLAIEYARSARRGDT